MMRMRIFGIGKSPRSRSKFSPQNVRHRGIQYYLIYILPEIKIRTRALIQRTQILLVLPFLCKLDNITAQLLIAQPKPYLMMRASGALNGV